MQNGIKIKLFKAGYCTHPSFVIKPGSGIKPRKFPAGIALIKHPEQGYILFDVGYHPNFFTSTQSFPEKFYKMVTPCHLQDKERIVEQLKNEDIQHSDIQHLLLSHFHADHVAGIVDFPNTQIHCHPSGFDYMNQANRINRVRKGYLKKLLPDDIEQRLNYIKHFPLDLAQILDLPIKKLGLNAFDLFNDGTIYIVNLPGHAAGQVGMLIRLTNAFIFLLADACWLIDGLRDKINQHWIANIISDNHKEYKDTLKKLRLCFDHCSNNITYVPSHCSETLDPLIKKGWIA